MAQSKATKKFEKKHLKGTLDKRKENAKIKQRFQLADKKKSRKNRPDAEWEKGPKEDASKKPANSKTKNVGEMSVDDFFQGGFDDIIDKEQGGKKRKRAVTVQKKDEDGSDAEFDVSEEAAAEESDAEQDDEDEEGEMSKKTMDELAKKDPEFYKFLQENDPEALDFDDMDDDMAEIDDLSAGEDDEDNVDQDEQPKKKKAKKAKKAQESDDEEEEDAAANSSELTRKTIAGWKKAMTETKSLRATRQVVLAFRCAARLSEDEASGEPVRYVISNSEVFNDILMLALTEIPNVINHHLPVKESAAGRVYVQTDSNKFKTLSALLKSYASSIMHLLSTLSDDKTLKLTLSALTPILPYLLSFKKIVRALAKSVIGFWSQPASSETTRLTAFLVLRRLVVISDKGIRETVLKATYQGLIQGCRVTNAVTISGINLMKNSAAELWGIDPQVGYTTAFAFIRQLAIHLRNSIVNNKKDSFRLVYNWQYTHSLDFWSCVLAEHCNSAKEAESGKENQLRLLIYPLVQVTLGAMRLIPTATYFPLRFHLIRSLLRVSRATGTYIPLASPLLEVLSSAEMRKPPKNSTGLKAFEFHLAYKAPKSYLHTRTYQDGVGDQVADLFGEYFLLWSTSIAFPELALPVNIQLKRWIKAARSGSSGNKNNKLVSQLSILVQKLEANGKFIEEKRQKVDFAPKNRAGVEGFLKDFEIEKTPLGAYVIAQRKIRAERLRLLEDARREDEKKRKEEEQEELEEGMDVDDEDDEDEDMDDEEGSEDGADLIDDEAEEDEDDEEDSE